MSATMKRAPAAAIAGLVLLATSSGARAAPIADFVFLIDASVSMAGEIGGVRAGFSSFVSGLNAAGVDSRFAVIVFGGEPELILDFTSDATAAEIALNSIIIGSNPGIHNNHNLNPEAGLEAFRMALGGAVNSELANNNIPQDGFLNYRSSARKNLILATDEDSDIPFFAANRFTGQPVGGDGLTNSPPSTGPNAGASWDGWQAEIDATAQAVIDSQAFLNMLIGTDSPSFAQYGDFNKDVADADLLNFDPAATLAALQADPFTDESLQAQVLDAGLIARTFTVAGANNSDFVNNFFAAKVQETVIDPGPDPGPQTVPEPATALLLGLGLGLAGIGWRRAKKT